MSRFELLALHLVAVTQLRLCGWVLIDFGGLELIAAALIVLLGFVIVVVGFVIVVAVVPAAAVVAVVVGKMPHFEWFVMGFVSPVVVVELGMAAVVVVLVVVVEAVVVVAVV